MFTDDMTLTGHVTIFLNGQVAQEIPNLVVTTGKAFVASRMTGTSEAVMSHMAIGTGTTAAAASDTALGAEAARVALSGTSASSNVVTYSATFPAGTGTGALTEAALLNASSAGTMLCRTVYSVINKGSADSCTIQWQVTAS